MFKAVPVVQLPEVVHRWLGGRDGFGSPVRCPKREACRSQHGEWRTDRRIRIWRNHRSADARLSVVRTYRRIPKATGVRLPIERDREAGVEP